MSKDKMEMNEEGKCPTCGLLHWSIYVQLPEDVRAKTSACPGHVNISELVDLPHGAQIFPDNEALWDIVKQVADRDVVCEENMHGMPIYYFCPFCSNRQDVYERQVIRVSSLFPHRSDCIVTKARALIEQRDAQPKIKFHAEIEDASIIANALIRSHVVRGDPQILDVSCEQCGKCYHGSLEDMQGWYEYVEPPHRRYAFCSEKHMEQWKVKHGTG